MSINFPLAFAFVSFMDGWAESRNKARSVDERLSADEDSDFWLSMCDEMDVSRCFAHHIPSIWQ